MNREQALQVVRGDVLVPDPLWNRYERYDKLGERVEVLEVRYAECQTGVMFRVRLLKGTDRWMAGSSFLAATKARPAARSDVAPRNDAPLDGDCPGASPPYE
jgi:hypothetical protein